ncbi:MAG: cytochrome c oxidase assembly protein, partial [Pseudomonadota bacterium]
MDPYTPFCGTPPIPTELLTRWTFDPVLLAVLLAALAVGLARLPDRRRFVMAWALVAVLFVSPLCAASMALFSARVAQHILLTLVAAPLLAGALPRTRISPLGAAVVFAALFWLWHAPAPYQATLASDLTYWAMHLSLFASATLMFASLRAAPEQAVL